MKPLRAAWLSALACLGAHAAPLDVQVVDARGVALDGAVVWVESAAAKAAAKPLAGVEVGQQNRQFVPQVSVVTTGTVVAFPNRDTVRHHLYSFSPKKFDRKLYLGRDADPETFDRPGIAVLGCNIHDQMAGWVVVLETPWFATSGKDGRARLEVPAGAHRLRAWHLAMPVGAPAAEQPLQLGAGGGSATLALTLEAGAR